MGNAVSPPIREINLQDSKLDTVTLAKQEREKQGPWEAEVSYGGEADLQKHLTSCVKNPGHQTFVPVDQFNVNHLPPGCRDNDLVDLVRAMSDLTVRVSVKYVSERRPETVPGSGKPYPSYKDRYSGMTRLGTGAVWKVDKYPNNRYSFTTCKCQECLDSPTPKAQVAKIHIHTAGHVVYDELEAAHTTCHLFFDKGDSPTPRDCSGVLELFGWEVVGRETRDGDWCHMVHMTHNLDLADLLHVMVDRFDNLMRNVNSACHGLGSSSQSAYLREVWDKLTIIVSHPHGCNKQISVGYWNYADGRSHPTSPRYTTSTCPGSSGAPVFMTGGVRLAFWTIRHVHCGNCEDDKNLNFSNFSWF